MNETMYEEVDRRISELRRPDWRWVQRAPQFRNEMCAVVDRGSSALSDETRYAICAWMQNNNIEPGSLVHFNDFYAKTVDDVIELLEKFRAEL